MKMEIRCMVVLVIFLDLFAAISCYSRVRRGLCSTRYLAIPNGDYGIRSSNTVVTYTCKTGFLLYGHNQLVCFGMKWNYDPPMCIANTCPPIQPTANLRLTEAYNGSVIKFSCAVLNKLEGTDKLICDGTNWSDNAPTCIPYDHPMECTFENSDLCGWSHTDADDKDWLWQQGPTTTSRTGPTFDHTLGISGIKTGHYMYFESSSPTRTGHEAFLFSPLYPASYSDIYCFKFWYHSFGVGDIGKLEVFIKPDNANLTDLTPMFVLESSLGEEWHEKTIDILTMHEPFSIYFVGTKATSYRSDFAFDDVSLIKCPKVSTTTKSTTMTTTLLPLPTQPLTSRTPATTTSPTVKHRTSTSSTTKLTTITTSPKPQTTTRKYVTTPSMTSTTARSTTKRWPMTTMPKTTVTMQTRGKPTTFSPVITTSPHTRLTTQKSRSSLPPIINPNVPKSPSSASQTTKKEDNSNIMYTFTGVGLVVAIAIVCVVAFYIYKKRKDRYAISYSEGAVNPLYSVIENDETAIQFAKCHENSE